MRAGCTATTSLFGRSARALALLAVWAAAPLAAQTVGAAGGSSSVPAADSLRDAELDAMTATIGSKLRCLVCRGQSVQESSAPLAREMQALIRSKLEAGETPEEIEAFFLASYGDFILLKPRARGLGALVYILPAALFLLAFGTVAFKFRTARTSGSTTREAGGTARTASFPGADLPEADREWLEAAVRGDR